MEIDRRTLLRHGAAAGLVGLAGCSGGGGDGGGDAASSGSASPTESETPTEEPTPSPTPACRDTTYRDTVGEFDIEYGVKSTDEGERYEGTLRIYQIRRPPCLFEGMTPRDGGDCGERSEELLVDQEYTASNDISYDIASTTVTQDVDSYRLEWAVDGATDVMRGVEQAARHLVDDLRYDFYSCDPGARRFAFAVVDGNPRIVQGSEIYGGD